MPVLIPLTSVHHITVLNTPAPTFRQRLAASELVRGLLQLGCPRSITVAELPGPAPAPGELRFVLLAERGTVESCSVELAQESGGLGTLTVRAPSDAGLLNGVFGFLEQQGAYFGVDGDLYPLDKPTALTAPDAGQPWTHSPRLATRGLLPWPDFLNCITVYNREDFRAYLEAMLRMRLNTLGIHVYGQGAKWAESFLSFEYGGVGHTAFTDTTATDRWGYLPQRTSRFALGAAQYYDDEVFGSDATRLARSPWEAAELAQALWRDAFAYAEQLGIRTGVGFEPYQVPDEIFRAAPPETRIVQVHRLPNEDREVRTARIDPTSRAARYILEARLAQLLEAYPSVSYVYLWEDEMMNWASQAEQVDLPVTPFKQAHDFLRRHAPDKRLVLAGWGGVVRHFESFHKQLPEDVIFTALSDQLGWDPIHEAFGKLGDRERWPIPWIEDDPSMWFPQIHAHRFAKDLALAEQYGCQGVLGIHWRHRIIDPVAGYMARRFWNGDLQPAEHYHAYARTQASGRRADGFARWLEEVDTGRKFLSTWTGELRPDGHAKHQEFSGDYNEAFLIERNYDISDAFIAAQAKALDDLEALYSQAQSPLERERLGYWRQQSKFLDPYARAWQVGRRLHNLIQEQHTRKKQGDVEGAAAVIHTQGIGLWVELLGHMREAVLAYQRSVATRNDLGTLASIHNKFVRIAAFRLGASLLEFLDELPAEAEEARQRALAPDTSLEAAVIVPTRPTRLAAGEAVAITAIAPGARELTDITLCWRPVDATAWRCDRMIHVGRRTYTALLNLPPDAPNGIEYVVRATFAGMPAPAIVTAPPEGAFLLTR